MPARDRGPEPEADRLMDHARPVETARPLRGMKVLELGHIAAAPFASLLLADLGADVVKVEPPGGDGMRGWPPFFDLPDGPLSANFLALNRNKRVLRADLKDPGQRAEVRSLGAEADVVIENYRPGVLEKLGLGFDDLAGDAGRSGGLIYCSISGYGRSSPYSDHGAFDVVVQAASGLMSVTGEAGHSPVKSGVPVGDFVTALYAALTITALAPVVRRDRRPRYVDCSMLDCLLGISALQTSEYWCTGAPPGRLGNAHPRNAPYQVFGTADRPIAIAAGTARLWSTLCDVLGLGRLTGDPRFADQVSRVRNQEVLAREIESVLTTRPADSWFRTLTGRGVPCAPVNSFAEVLGDSHVQAGGLLDEIRLDDHGTTSAFRYPVRVDGFSPAPAATAPSAGADLPDVLATWRSSE